MSGRGQGSRWYIGCKVGGRPRQRRGHRWESCAVAGSSFVRLLGSTDTGLESGHPDVLFSHGGGAEVDAIVIKQNSPAETSVA